MARKNDLETCDFFLVDKKNELFFPTKPTFLYSLDPIDVPGLIIFVPAEKKIFDGDYGIGPFRASVRPSVRPSESFLDSNQTYFFEFLIVYRCSRTRYFRHSTNFDPF